MFGHSCEQLGERDPYVGFTLIGFGHLRRKMLSCGKKKNNKK